MDINNPNAASTGTSGATNNTAGGFGYRYYTSVPQQVGAVPEIQQPPAVQGVISSQQTIETQNAVAKDYPATTAFSAVISPENNAAKNQSQNKYDAVMNEPIISFRNVCKVYPSQPNRPALNDISLDIMRGEFVFLVGHSGSGKSTFIKLLNREIVPTSGQLFVAGQDLVKMRSWKVPYLRRNTGCVFQDFKLLPKKTVYENVAFALEVIGTSRHIIRTQVPEVLRLVGLEEQMSKRPDQISGGEQQRVSIARAVVNRPPLLICDEPTGNLDPQTSLGIMKLLERINRTGTTVLVATHDREMVNAMQRRVIALDGGELVRDQDQGGYGSRVH